MPSIVAYQKASDAYATYELQGPAGEGAPQLIELCTLDGVTYVAVPDGVTLPPQAPEIADSIAPVALTPELREAIKAASPHTRLINDRMIAMIRARYPVDEEFYIARISVGPVLGLYEPTPEEQQEIVVYGEFIESVREWGRAERAKLGLYEPTPEGEPE